MKRSDILKILARRLGNREVDDIYEDALAEMAFVQSSVLERLPVQPYFLEQDETFPLPAGTSFVELPEEYNGLMTQGGVWLAPATLAPVEPVIVDCCPEWEENIVWPSYEVRDVSSGNTAGIPTPDNWTFPYDAQDGNSSYFLSDLSNIYSGYEVVANASPSGEILSIIDPFTIFLISPAPLFKPKNVCIYFAMMGTGLDENATPKIEAFDQNGATLASVDIPVDDFKEESPDIYNKLEIPLTYPGSAPFQRLVFTDTGLIEIVHILYCSDGEIQDILINAPMPQ